MKPSEQIGQGGTLQVQHDMREQERIWRIQLWGRIVLLLFLLAGLVGVFGGSWLGKADHSDASGRFRVEHPRLARVQAPYELRLEVSGELASEGEVVVWLGTGLLQSLQIDSIRPTPSSEEIAADRVLYRFAVAEPVPTIPLSFHATTVSVGAAWGRVGVAGGPELTVRHFIHP